MLFISNIGHRIDAKDYPEAMKQLLADLGITIEVA
jgi:hypothetical protein